MKLPFIMRRKHEQILRVEILKARREQEKAVLKFIQVRWDKGSNADGSRQEINFEHLAGRLSHD